MSREKKRKTTRRFSKLNPMRRRLLKEIGKGKSVGEASKLAGYSHPTAANNAIQSMRPQIMEALHKSGWGPDEFVAKHMIPLLQAKKTLFFAHEGIVCDKRTVTDNGARLTAGDQYLKIVGGYAPSKENATINISNFVGLGTLPRPAANQPGVAVQGAGSGKTP